MNESFTFKRVLNRFDYQLPGGPNTYTPTIFESTDYILTAVDQFASSIFYANGISGAVFNYPVANRVIKNLNNLWVLDNCPEISLSELIIFDRNLTEEERISVQDYLEKKWGIKV